MSNAERTLSIIKPDAVERNLSEKIKSIFFKNNLQILDTKKLHISKDEAAEFYKVHQSKPFYDQLCNYLSSGPIEVMILEGENAVLKNRELMGATDPKNAKEDGLSENFMVFLLIKILFMVLTLKINAKIEINFFFNK